jgi:hypothetical protein
VPYASRVIVKLLVLVALAFSLGDLRDATQVADEVSLIESEPTADVTPDVVIAGYTFARSLPREVGMLPDVIVFVPRSRDAGRIFRPPRA